MNERKKHELLESIYDHRGMLMGRARTLRYIQGWPVELEPEDIVSGTFEKAIAGISSFEGSTKGKFRGWMMKILNNVVADRLDRFYTQKRGEGKVRSLDSFLSQSQSCLEGFLKAEMSGVSSPLRREELLQAVYEKIEQLPEEQREALLLRFITQLKIKEIASLLGCTPKAISNRIYRALNNLKSAFGVKE